jgi:glucose-1-phosphate adenylyltransferase
VKGGTIRNSVIRREVTIAEDVVLEDCVIMDHCSIARGARLRRTIVDRYNCIEAGTRIGFDRDSDRARYHVTDSGVVVVPMGPVPAHANLYE